MRSRLGAILAVAMVAGAVGTRMWMDSGDLPVDSSKRVDASRLHAEGRHRVVASATARPEESIGHLDEDSTVSHIGEPLDPDAEPVRPSTEMRHIGDFLSPEADLVGRGKEPTIHIGVPRDPDDDWRPVPGAGLRHIGEPIGPDSAVVGEAPAAHIGEPLEPPAEDAAWRGR